MTDLPKNNNNIIKKSNTKTKNIENSLNNLNNTNDNDSVVTHDNKIKTTKTQKKNKKKKKRVKFNENFVTLIEVQSYKKFNLLNTSEDPMSKKDKKNKLHCTCIIF